MTAKREFSASYHDHKKAALTYAGLVVVLSVVYDRNDHKAMSFLGFAVEHKDVEILGWLVAGVAVFYAAVFVLNWVDERLTKRPSGAQRDELDLAIERLPAIHADLQTANENLQGILNSLGSSQDSALVANALRALKNPSQYARDVTGILLDEAARRENNSNSENPKREFDPSSFPPVYEQSADIERWSDLQLGKTLLNEAALDISQRTTEAQESITAWKEFIGSASLRCSKAVTELQDCLRQIKQNELKLLVVRGTRDVLTVVFDLGAVLILTAASLIVWWWALYGGDAASPVDKPPVGQTTQHSAFIPLDRADAVLSIQPV